MARLLTTGFESRLPTTSKTTNGEGQETLCSGTVTADTTHQYDGSVCAKFLPSATNAFILESSTTLGVTYYAQAALRFSSVAPSSNVPIMKMNGVAGLELYLITNGTLSFINGKTGENVKGEFLSISAEKTYLVEMKCSVPSSGNSTVAIRVLNEEGGLLYESGDQSVVFGNTALSSMRIGHLAAGDTKVTVYASHMIVNDSTGEQQISWVGYQKVVMLKPVSDNANTGWSRSTSGTTTELYKGVNHFPPEGVAYASRTAESEIASAEAAAANGYTANLQSYTEAGVGEKDTVKAVMAIGRSGQSATTNRSMTYTLTNPSEFEVKGTGATTAGTEVTGWTTGVTHPIYTAPTLGTRPTLQVSKPTSPACITMCDMLGAYVSYEPAAEASQGKATIAGTSTITATGSVTATVITGKGSVEGTSTFSGKGAVKGKPTVTAEAATEVKATEATLNATVNLNGAARSLGREGLVVFEWGLTTSYGSVAEEELGIGTSTPFAVSRKVTSLTAGQTYHFRISATNELGETHGEDGTFATSASVTGKGSIAGTSAFTANGRAVVIESALTGITFPPPEVFNEPLAIAVAREGTTIGRWGPDEWDAANIPQNLTFGSTAPGGDKSASFNLPRKIDQEYGDLQLFDDITIYRPGAETVWRGRVAQLPRTHGTTYSINVGAVGYQAALEDDPTFREIYIDRDFSSWTGPSSARRIALRGGSYSPQSPSVITDAATQLPALEMTLTGAWSGVTPIQEPIYDAGPGLKVGYMYAEWVLNTGDPNFQFQAGTATDDSLAAMGALGADLATGGSAGIFTWAPTPQRVVFWDWYYGSNAAGAAGAQYTALLRRMAMHGDHGLTRRGNPASNTEGYYASDVINHVLGQAGTGLTYSLGGSIEETTFSIPHLVFKDPTTAATVINAANAYHQYEWLVYDKEFIFRQPNPERLTWEARLSDGAQVNFEGDLAETVYNGVYVQFTTPDGLSRTAGPTGSTAEFKSTFLEDTTATNPVNAAGISRRWAVLSISQVTTEAGAIQLGSAYLSQTSLPQRRGSITLQGSIRHPQKGRMPVTTVKAGDWIRIGDITADVPRRIVEAQYNTVTKTLECSLDNTSTKIEAILERIGVSNIGILG